MGRAKKFSKTPKLPQAQSADEIAARDKLEDSKQKARAGRRADCDDKPKKKKQGDESDSDSFDDGSDDDMFDKGPEPESESEEEEGPAEAKKPKNLMDQLGVQLEGATNLNSKAKSESKAVSAKGAKMDAKPELSRREREAMEAQQKAQAYRKKHEAGETDEAKSDLARLQEVRRRREEAKKKRDADETDAKEESEDAEASKKGGGKPAAKIELPTPTQKEVKSALMKLQDCASEDFQNKWKLKGASGNKLAKMKYGDFNKLWQDFVDNGDESEHREYMA